LDFISLDCSKKTFSRVRPGRLYGSPVSILFFRDHNHVLPPFHFLKTISSCRMKN
jgi:hypothetical protein